ncbi:hypothetical protein H8959_014781 [Pygathrix nigripes]
MLKACDNAVSQNMRRCDNLPQLSRNLQLLSISLSPTPCHSPDRGCSLSLGPRMRRHKEQNSSLEPSKAKPVTQQTLGTEVGHLTSSDFKTLVCQCFQLIKGTPFTISVDETGLLLAVFGPPSTETAKPKASSNTWVRKQRKKTAGEPPLGVVETRLPVPGYFRACERRLLAKAKLSGWTSSALLPLSSASGRWRPGMRRPSKEVRNGAGTRRCQPHFAWSPEPLPREDKTAKEKVYLVLEHPGKERQAPRR